MFEALRLTRSVRELRLFAACLAWALFALPRYAQADEPTLQACSEAYTQGQEERLAGRAYQAYKSFGVCSESACPSVVSGDCRVWRRQVEQDLPSIELRALASDQSPVEGVSLLANGEAVALAPAGQGTVLDIGRQHLELAAPGYRVATWDGVLRPEDKNRALTVTLLRTDEPDAQPALRPTPGVLPAPLPTVNEPRDPNAARLPLGPLVVGGAGVVTLGLASVLGISAQNRFDDLQKSCAPNCTASQADSVDRAALATDVTLAAGLVLVGVAAVWFLTEPSRPKPAPSALLIPPHRKGSAAAVVVRF